MRCLLLLLFMFSPRVLHAGSQLTFSRDTTAKRALRSQPEPVLNTPLKESHSVFGQCCRQAPSSLSLSPNGAGRFFFLLIQTLPTFWATRILILRIFICLFVRLCGIFYSCTSMVKDSMGRRTQWMVKYSMDGEGINGWKGRRIQWMVKDSVSFISS